MDSDQTVVESTCSKCEGDEWGHLPHCPVPMEDLRADRDRWIRLFNRLQGAVSHHRNADRFKDDHDEALYKAMDAVLRDAGPTEGGKSAAPRMALRPHHEFEREMDDIVVNDVEMFRAEQMSDDSWFMCCYFANGDRVAFGVHREKKPPRVAVYVTEEPESWVDIDEEKD